MPELSVGRFDLNDSVFHYTMVHRMVQAIDRGENPLDCWVSEWTFGYAVSRTYQPLGHLLVAVIHIASGRTVSAMTAFIWVRYLAVVLFPLTIFWGARLFQLSENTAAAAALLSPLVSTNGLFGLEYGSYVWRGNGLFTQAIAMHLMVIAIGLGFRCVRVSGKCTLAGLTLGLTFLAHFVYGYMGAISVCVFAVVGGTSGLSKRLWRLAVVGVTSVCVSAFVLIPALMDSPWVNHSRWEPVWKWDSFGGSQVLKYTFTGELLDYGRLPVLSLLVLLGAIVSLRHLKAQRATAFAPAILVCGAALWLVLFFGRPTWGVLYSLLGPADMQLHRLIGAVHVFCIFVGGIGLGKLWEFVSIPRTGMRVAAAGLLTVVILAPAIAERRAFLQQNAEWGNANVVAQRAEQPMLDEVINKLKSAPGRVYAGLAAGWGRSFRVGDVPLYGILSTNRIPSVGFLYHAMALTSDVMVLFDERIPAQYRLFNISTFLSESNRTAPIPMNTEQVGRFRISDAPGGGYFDVVHVPFAIAANKENVYDTSSRWLQSEWVSKQVHIYLDFRGNAPPKMPRLSLGQALPNMGNLPTAGSIERESHQGQQYDADVNATEAAYVLFKMTYHPNWRAYVDGVYTEAVVLTPGFVGVPVSIGRHHISIRYEPGRLKTFLLVAGVISLGLLIIAEGIGWLGQVEGYTGRCVTQFASNEHAGRCLIYIGLLALAAPVCVPLLTNDLPSGHDAYSYHPRLIEFHENISHGVLLPRWAPDLEFGAGQPLFLFTPPLLFYIAELWRLMGAASVTALNLAAICVILASAFGMFKLADFYFGRKAGWLSAAAYTYAPYYHVDLYVRHALAEFAAFAFYPFILYFFGRYAKKPDPKFLFFAAASYAGLVVTHNQSALLFSPLLLAFLVFLSWQGRSMRLFFRLALGLVSGLVLSAFVWLPALVEMKFVSIDRSVQDYLSYRNHFVFLPQFFSSAWGYGLSVIGPSDQMSFSFGLGHLVIAIAAAVLAWKLSSGELRVWVIFWTTTLGILVVLMLPVSAPVWGILPLLNQVQFPWRLLGPASLSIAILAAVFGGAIDRNVRRSGCFFVAGLAILILPNLTHIRPERYFQIDSKEWTPQFIAQSGFETTTSYEFEPRWVKQREGYWREEFRLVSGEAMVSDIVRSPTLWRANVSGHTESVLQARLLYFPSWAVSVDGQETTPEVSDSGRIQFRVPPGVHQISIRFKPTTIRVFSETISFLGLIGMLLFFRRGTSAENDNHR